MAKLPVIDTIAAAYAAVFAGVKPLSRAAAVPLMVMLVVIVRDALPESPRDADPFGDILRGILPIVAFIPFETQFCRYVLKLSPDQRPRFGFPWGSRESWYLVHSIGINAAAMATFAALWGYLPRLLDAGDLAASRAEIGTGGLGLLSLLLILVLTVAAVGVFARLFLALPAASVGRVGDWRHIWRLARGNAFRIALAQIIGMLSLIAVQIWFLLPVFLFSVFQGPARPRGQLPHPEFNIVEVVVTFAANLLVLFNFLVVLAIAALSYRFLVTGTHGTAEPAAAVPA
jgi:hypothetical protein